MDMTEYLVSELHHITFFIINDLKRFTVKLEVFISCRYSVIVKLVK